MLWTRLAPRPLEGGGMPDSPVAVDWQIAEDEKFARVVAQATVQAAPAEAHAVHVEAKGLRPAALLVSLSRRHALSAIGRTRTAPAAGSTPSQFRFAFASCAQYEQGYFAAIATWPTGISISS